MEFDPKTTIVTGSDSGIGRATAGALAQNGTDIGGTWHSDEAGAQATVIAFLALPRLSYVTWAS